MGSPGFSCLRLRAFAYLPKDRFEEDLILNGRDLIKHTKMDAIKKKMQAMKLEKDNAMDRADACEQQAKDANLRAEKAEEEVRDLQKKMQQLESDLDVTQEKLLNANQKLEEKEEALEKSEERLLIATQKLDQASTAADDNQRMCKVLENKSLSDESRMEALENQLKEARMLAEEADKKYDECAKKLATVEGDLDRAEERADTSEHKIIELEEELRVVGNNLK